MEFHSSDPLGLVGKTGTSLWCSMNGNAEAFYQHRNCKSYLKNQKQVSLKICPVIRICQRRSGWPDWSHYSGDSGLWALRYDML